MPRTRTEWRARTAIAAFAAVPVLGMLGGCDTPGDAAKVEQRVSGDTTIVRTLAGSVWGEMRTLELELSIGEAEGDERYIFGAIAGIGLREDGSVVVLDRQASVVRRYDADGGHLGAFGRAGEGPGEFRSASGLVVLPDGGTAVLDWQAQRVSLFDADGTSASTVSALPAPPFSELRGDDRGRLYVPVRLTEGPRSFFSTEGILVVTAGAAEAARDTLIPPVQGREQARFEIPGFSTTVPLSPREHFAFAPPDRFAVGWSGEYAVSVQSVREEGEGILRIERDWDPVPIPAEERDARARQALRPVTQMLGGDPPSRLPPVPATKPAFRALRLLDDGRIVVIRELASVPEENAGHNPEDPLSSPRTWVAPVVLDVFESDGTFLGALQLPPGVQSSSPSPVFAGDRVWAVYTDDLGVQRVGRFRIVPFEGGNPGS